MLRLRRSVRNAIVAHAREGAPEEVCGVLAGSRDTGGNTPSDTDSRTDRDDRADRTDRDDRADRNSRIDRADNYRRVHNAAETPETRYVMDSTELLETVEAVEGAGDDVVGFSHSHPRGPQSPSETDRERATWDGYLYVIVSLDGDASRIGAWRWHAADDRFDREPITIVE